MLHLKAKFTIYTTIANYVIFFIIKLLFYPPYFLGHLLQKMNNFVNFVTKKWSFSFKMVIFKKCCLEVTFFKFSFFFEGTIQGFNLISFT